MKIIIFILTVLICPNLFAATLTPNTIPYVCNGGSTPQLCNSTTTTDTNGNLQIGWVPNNVQVFTSSGTWINPGWVTKVYVKVWGAGGGGASYDGANDVDGGGGGSGGYSEGVLSVVGNGTVTIGPGGIGSGGSYGNGTNGSNSSFSISGGTITADGGTAGQNDLPNGSGTVNGNGGGASGGQINLGGWIGNVNNNTTSFYGFPYGYGGSGSDGSTFPYQGSNGGNGLVIVYY